jgi:hypothetical protein
MMIQPYCYLAKQFFNTKQQYRGHERMGLNQFCPKQYPKFNNLSQAIQPLGFGCCK